MLILPILFSALLTILSIISLGLNPMKQNKEIKKISSALSGKEERFMARSWKDGK